jgi:hypothetical protein
MASPTDARVLWENAGTESSLVEPKAEVVVAGYP